MVHFTADKIAAASTTTSTDVSGRMQIRNTTDDWNGNPLLKPVLIPQTNNKPGCAWRESDGGDQGEGEMEREKESLFVKFSK